MTIMRPLSTALLLLAAPLIGLAQSIGGLTARATASSIALRPTSLEGAALEDLQFSYSQDAGATWKPIEASCLEFVSGEAIWHVLECLQVDVFEGSNIQFKASALACDPVTFDGYTYEVAQIGTQCWFAENLRSTHYANGDALVRNLTASEWKKTSSGAQTFYRGNATFLYSYGRLYNWYAVDDPRGLCPIGWHVPTDADYSTVEEVLGIMSSDANSIELSETDEVAQINSIASESPSWKGLNNTALSALPGGRRSSSGSFDGLGYLAYFWCSSLNGSSSWSRWLGAGSDDLNRSYFDLRNGFSVRCVRD